MFWLLLFCFIPDGELVLRNGKVLRYQGEYQQEGQWVRFTDHRGEYLQLPLKIVDFEKTQARVDSKKAKAAASKEAKRQAALAKPEKTRVVASGTSAAVVEDRLPVRTIDNKGLQDRSRNRPLHSYYGGPARQAELKKPIDSMDYQALKTTERNLTQEISLLQYKQALKTATKGEKWEMATQARLAEEAKKKELLALKEKLSRVKKQLKALESAEAKSN